MTFEYVAPNDEPVIVSVGIAVVQGEKMIAVVTTRGSDVTVKYRRPAGWNVVGEAEDTLSRILERTAA